MSHKGAMLSHSSCSLLFGGQQTKARTHTHTQPRASLTRHALVTKSSVAKVSLTLVDSIEIPLISLA